MSVFRLGSEAQRPTSAAVVPEKAKGVQVQAERRSKDRAKNVHRLAASKSDAPPKRAPAVEILAKAGSAESDWEEF
jgi:hypothetical protein